MVVTVFVLICAVCVIPCLLNHIRQQRQEIVALKYELARMRGMDYAKEDDASV